MRKVPCWKISIASALLPSLIFSIKASPASLYGIALYSCDDYTSCFHVLRNHLGKHYNEASAAKCSQLKKCGEHLCSSFSCSLKSLLNQIKNIKTIISRPSPYYPVSLQFIQSKWWQVWTIGRDPIASYHEEFHLGISTHALRDCLPATFTRHSEL